MRELPVESNAHTIPLPGLITQTPDYLELTYSLRLETSRLQEGPCSPPPDSPAASSTQSSTQRCYVLQNGRWKTRDGGWPRRGWVANQPTAYQR